MRLKPEKYQGYIVSFQKKYQYISKDYPSSPYINAIVNDKVIASGFTKTEAFDNAKMNIRDFKRTGGD